MFCSTIVGTLLIALSPMFLKYILDGSIPKGEIERMMDNSTLLVVSKMTKKDQQSLLMHL